MAKVNRSSYINYLTNSINKERIADSTKLNLSIFFYSQVSWQLKILGLSIVFRHFHSLTVQNAVLGQKTKTFSKAMLFKIILWVLSFFVHVQKNQKKLWQISSLRERSGKRRGSTSFGFLLAAAYLLHIELALKNRDLVTVIIFTLVSNKKVIALLTSKHCAPAWKMIIV